MDSDEPVVGSSEVKKLEDRVRELERMRGRKTMEAEILRDQPVVNAKRVYRIMGNNAMLLERHTVVRKGRIHDGKVMVMRSNLRWCSDGLEFTCWNGEVIRLAFIIDAFDREIIAWTAVANAGISGSDVRDMMLEAVEKRFAATRAPHAIEHLSDIGSAYTARDTKLFAQALNLTPCFTPVASPQSNGMSEAFVKTLKRDYIRISPLPDAETALRCIDGWIEDYNEIHPHFPRSRWLPLGSSSGLYQSSRNVR